MLVQRGAVTALVAGPQGPAAAAAAGTGTTDWARHEVTAQIPPDANCVFFGVFLTSPGQIDIRNPQLEPLPELSAPSPSLTTNP